MIPEAVWKELNFGGRSWPGSAEVEKADWIEKHAVQDRRLILALMGELDSGEAESIGLALELQAGLKAGFYLNETLYREVLERAGETA
jgi:predicted nucleic acid-binding protein